jgi:hypothetical protein
LLLERSGTDRVPFIWFWPNGAPNCLMTRDVETADGRDYVTVDGSGRILRHQGVLSGHPEALRGTRRVRSRIRARGFEFNITT